MNEFFPADAKEILIALKLSGSVGLSKKFTRSFKDLTSTEGIKHLPRLYENCELLN